MALIVEFVGKVEHVYLEFSLLAIGRDCNLLYLLILIDSLFVM